MKQCNLLFVYIVETMFVTINLMVIIAIYELV